MSVELAVGLVAVVAMLGTVATKYIATVLLVRRRERLHETESQLSGLKDRLKTVSNERAVAESNEKNLNAQKERLERQVPNLEKQLRVSLGMGFSQLLKRCLKWHRGYIICVHDYCVLSIARIIPRSPTRYLEAILFIKCLSCYIRSAHLQSDHISIYYLG